MFFLKQSKNSLAKKKGIILMFSRDNKTDEARTMQPLVEKSAPYLERKYLKFRNVMSS